MPLMANLGDFLFSAIKRHFDIKDYSTILQEHGGILDRIDSLLMTSLYVAIVVTFISTGWNLLA
jgi:phosphatidate cytidylyltransferase